MCKKYANRFVVKIYQILINGFIASFMKSFTQSKVTNPLIIILSLFNVIFFIILNFYFYIKILKNVYIKRKCIYNKYINYYLYLL